MKLYATVTSERASKGQGGEYLQIQLQDVNKKVFCKLFVEKTFEGENIIALWKNKECEVMEFIAETSIDALISNGIKYRHEKGEKQTGEGEIPSCENHSHYRYDCIECAELQ